MTCFSCSLSDFETRLAIFLVSAALLGSFISFLHPAIEHYPQLLTILSYLQKSQKELERSIIIIDLRAFLL